jgi:hypothetical protein
MRPVKNLSWSNGSCLIGCAACSMSRYRCHCVVKNPLRNWDHPICVCAFANARTDGRFLIFCRGGVSLIQSSIAVIRVTWKLGGASWDWQKFRTARGKERRKSIAVGWSHLRRCSNVSGSTPQILQISGIHDCPVCLHFACRVGS